LLARLINGLLASLRRGCLSRHYSRFEDGFGASSECVTGVSCCGLMC
jgi:hypothetical protein